jgi:hypothetical protein
MHLSGPRQSLTPCLPCLLDAISVRSVGRLGESHRTFRELNDKILINTGLIVFAGYGISIG